MVNWSIVRGRKSMNPFVRILVLSTALVSIAWIFAVSSIAMGPQEDGREAAIAMYREGRAEEAVAAFDKLLNEKPDDGRLKIWKALATLEKARMMRLDNKQEYKQIVISTYGELKLLAYTQRDNPDWYFAMAKAYQLNDRSQKSNKALRKALYFRPKFPEALLLLADILREESENLPANSPGGMPPSPRMEKLREASKAYQAVLDLPHLPPALRAEALSNMGDIEAKLDEKKQPGRDWWEKAVSTAPESPFGKMAQERLKGKP
jgi:tetratricopeptide (TPR) repeat protein